VVAGGEHAADRAEDYYAEDGDDDAVGCQYLCFFFFFFISSF
jgi:hypothetical protein